MAIPLPYLRLYPATMVVCLFHGSENILSSIVPRRPAGKYQEISYGGLTNVFDLAVIRADGLRYRCSLGP
jgi:hypothetical protein